MLYELYGVLCFYVCFFVLLFASAIKTHTFHLCHSTWHDQHQFYCFALFLSIYFFFFFSICRLCFVFIMFVFTSRTIFPIYRWDIFPFICSEKVYHFSTTTTTKTVTKNMFSESTNECRNKNNSSCKYRLLIKSIKKILWNMS